MEFIKSVLGGKDKHKALPSIVTHCILGNFHAFLSSADYFLKLTFCKYSLRNTNRMSNSFDPDQSQ